MYPYDYNYGGLPPVNQPYNSVPYQPQKPVQQMNTNKIYVSGIEEVRQKSLPSGSDYIFLDNDKPILYQKIVSPSGQFEVKTFSISQYEPQETTKHGDTVDLSSYAKTSDLEPLMTELKALKKQVAEIYVDRKTKEA